ncbi:BCAS1 protein, partial [Scytalopus superciliaris]|nr:BCAS1 protein [Scytalopus superciliaris]
MGNTLSVPEEAEEDNTCTVKSYQALSESPDTIKNGSAVFAQAHSPAMNGEVAAKASVARDNVAVSSAETMGQGGQSLGSAASTARPAAKPRSVLAFPWAVPGRTEEPATDSSLASAKLDVSPVSGGGNKALREGAEAPGAAVPEEGSHKSPSRAPAPLRAVELAAPGTPEREDEAASKAKPVTFFDRIFKLEKGKERSKARGDPQEERQALDIPDGSIAAAELQSMPNGVPQGKASASEIDDCNPKDLRDSAGVNSPTAAQPEKAEVKQGSPQAAAGDNSVMSFLKTLVSPSKAEAKSDSEDKGSKAEKGHGGQPAPKAESPSKGAKKKKAESPKLGHSTFSKLFRHKAAKETQQTTNTKSPEQQPVTSVKPDKNVPPSQEPPTVKQNPKVPEAAAPPQGAASEAPREGLKEKPSATPLPLSKLFWKKNASEEADPVSNERAEASFEAVAPDRDESKSPEGSEVKPRGAESKTPKANLRKFFKLTLNPTERPAGPAEGDPAGHKSKESSKDKKATVEPSRQKGSKESREQPEPREQPAADTDSIQNGGDASKEHSYKKTEKRQSLGGFFKGL